MLAGGLLSQGGMRAPSINYYGAPSVSAGVTPTLPAVHQYAGFGPTAVDAGPQTAFPSYQGPYQSPASLATGYAPSANPAENAWNQKLSGAIANERAWTPYQSSFLGFNPAQQQAGFYKDDGNKNNFLLNAGLAGTYNDPTYGGATTDLASRIAGFKGFAPQQIGLNGKDQAQTRGMEMTNLDQLRLASLGQGPSAAQDQLQSATNANMRQQASLAASLRGGSNPAAMLSANNNAALLQQDSANASGALRAQEMQQAMGLYTGALTGVRGQDQSWAGQQAQVGLANQQLGLQAQSERDQALQGMMGLQYNYSSLGQQGDLARLGLQLQNKDLQNQAYQASMGRRGQGFGKFIAPAIGAAGNVLQGMVSGGAFRGTPAPAASAPYYVAAP